MIELNEDNFGRLVQDPVVISSEIRQHILENQMIRDRLDYDIEMTKTAIELSDFPRNLPGDMILKHILVQLEGTLNGDTHNYPKRLLAKHEGKK